MFCATAGTNTPPKPKRQEEFPLKTSLRIPQPQPPAQPTSSRGSPGALTRSPSLWGLPGLTLHSEALRPRRRSTPSGPRAGPSGRRLYRERPAGATGPFPMQSAGPLPRRGRSGGGAALGRGLQQRPLQSAPFGAVRGRAGLPGPQREASEGCAFSPAVAKRSAWRGRAGQVGTSFSSGLG